MLALELGNESLFRVLAARLPRSIIWQIHMEGYNLWLH